MGNIFIISALRNLPKKSSVVEKQTLPFSLIFLAPQINRELQQHLSSEFVVTEITGTQKTRPGFVGEATENPALKRPAYPCTKYCAMKTRANY